MKHATAWLSLLLFAACTGPSQNPADARGDHAAPEPVSPTGRELDPGEREALHAALDDERRSLATYDRVLEDFGPVPPFINVREAEARHIAALTRLFERYGVALPEDRWRDAAPRYATLSDACRAAVDAEKENAALYDRLLASTSRSDIRTVFGNLREASLERHLPAFERCAGRR